uniref:Apolipoprotein D n=1 Tax=Cyprinus carpio TaxID=7962 RepID=A0A8C1D427_CYPCA
MQALQVLSLTLLSVLAVSAQSIGSGKCPQPPVQQNFDLTKYMGRWYEITKIPARFQLGDCCQAIYTLSDGIVLVRNEQLLNGAYSFTEGTAKIADASEPAKLEVRFFEDAPPAPYWVLATDYDTYTLVYSCSDFAGLFRAEFSWIMSRTRTLPKETVSELLDILKSHGISTDSFTETDQRPELCSVMP